ncbi:hypothetical protein NL676_008319 [Syzygium grande]|nr:hypothetical protein NL676_008319 [Syzygium grande]
MTTTFTGDVVTWELRSPRDSCQRSPLWRQHLKTEPMRERKKKEKAAAAAARVFFIHRRCRSLELRAEHRLPASNVPLRRRAAGEQPLSESPSPSQPASYNPSAGVRWRGFDQLDSCSAGHLLGNKTTPA